MLIELGQHVEQPMAKSIQKQQGGRLQRKNKKLQSSRKTCLLSGQHPKDRKEKGVVFVMAPQDTKQSVLNHEPSITKS